MIRKSVVFEMGTGETGLKDAQGGGSDPDAEAPPHYALRCRRCGHTSTQPVAAACAEDFAPLEVHLDLALIAAESARPSLASEASIWRYGALLPVPLAARLPWQVGQTPLRKATRLGKVLGLEDLWIKDDTVNPTGSFKDRPTAVAVSHARALGLSTIGCASTGNLAAATAAAGAVAGLPTFVLVPASLGRTKLVAPTALGARVIPIDGTYDQVNRIANLLADRKGWGFVNINLRPFYTEGSKTLAFEVAEQLDWQTPDRIILPLGSGALLCAVEKGFSELASVGWLDDHRRTRFVGSQPVGCTPIVDAFAAGAEHPLPVQHPATIAESLAIGDPASGAAALKVIRSSGGCADAPTTVEVQQAIVLLGATEGVFVEPAGGTVVATARRLAQQGIIAADERVVLALTGSGLKTPGVLQVDLPPAAAPTLPSVEALLRSTGWERSLPTPAPHALGRIAPW